MRWEMTPERARSRLTAIKEANEKLGSANIKNSEARRNITALEMAIDLVSKNVTLPVKHINSREFGDAVFCPACQISLSMVSKCCPHCGQKLDEKSW